MAKAEYKDSEKIEYMGKGSEWTQSERRANLGDKSHEAKLGDVRLLIGVGAGVVLLCIMFFLIRASSSPEVAPPSPTGETAVVAPQAQTIEPEEGTAAEGVVGESWSYDVYDYDMGQSESVTGVPAQRTPEEQERLLREMANDIPEGETLVW
jgi:hypothetical protein